MAAIFAACSNQESAQVEVAEIETEVAVPGKPEKSLILGFEAEHVGSKYMIHNNTEGSWKLFGGNSHANINWAESLGEMEASTSMELAADSIQRMFFAAVNDADTVWFSNRHIEMDGPVNFRDVGGLTTKDGKTVKWGSVFRSDNISGLTASDLRKMADMGIGMDIDFRQDHEIQADPDALPADGSIEYINLAMGDTSAKGGMATFMQKLNEVGDQPEKIEQVIMGFYTQIPLAFADKYKTYFQILAEEEDGVMFHCSAGKDRTGIASALLLYTLGVDMEDIKNEYALSNYYRYETNLAFGDKMAQYGISPEVAPLLMGVKPEYMDAIFGAIAQSYGSVDNYLETALGVDAEMKSLLRAKYLL